MSSPDANLWNQILDRLREEVEPEEYRRWFSPTTYASDSGDLITVWVPTEATRRYISTHYTAHIERTLRRMGVIRELEEQGFHAGEDVEIAGIVFDLDP